MSRNQTVVTSKQKLSTKSVLVTVILKQNYWINTDCTIRVFPQSLVAHYKVTATELVTVLLE